jgi:hypothetical protein
MRKLDARRYNLPTASEVAVVVVGDGEDGATRRDIVVWLRGGGVRHIHECHPLYESLHFVLLFPTGDCGWHLNMTHVGAGPPARPAAVEDGEEYPGEDDGGSEEEGGHEGTCRLITHVIALPNHAASASGDVVRTPRRKKNDTVTSMEYAAYRLHFRRDCPGENIFIRSGRLSQVDFVLSVCRVRLLTA